jgi:fructoselysine-6-P-deglycase FrlB-like protein
MVLFSKSGGTEELVKLIPYAKAKGAKLVGVSSNQKSKLAVGPHGYCSPRTSSTFWFLVP